MVDTVYVAPRAERAREVREFLLEHVDENPNVVATLARKRFGVTRQAVNKHIQALVQEGLLVAEGQTSGIRYRRSRSQREWVFPIAGLSEHEVWQTSVAPMLKGLPDNVVSISEYGFTEMLNNAIDHSEAEEVEIAVRRTAKTVAFDIIDRGVGIFNKIQRACNLEDPRHAVFELTKGKLTTDPERHTGEGIFFTSRMFDDFSILSGGLFLSHTRDNADWLLGDQNEAERGTLIGMEISALSAHTPQEVFDRYATEQEDFAFNKTHVLVRLADVSDRFVSRSQAKRILARLDKFREVILDFTGVHEVSPAFTDEIFRVFAKQHPNTHLIAVNANEQVTKMIRRAESHGASEAE